MTVYFGQSTGLPGRAVIGQTVLLFANYTDSTVDVAATGTSGQVQYAFGQRRPVLQAGVIRAALRAMGIGAVL